MVKEGDVVKVKLIGFDDRGKVRLSMKVVDQATGEDLSKKQQATEANTTASGVIELRWGGLLYTDGLLIAKIA